MKYADSTLKLRTCTSIILGIVLTYVDSVNVTLGYSGLYIQRDGGAISMAVDDAHAKGVVSNDTNIR